MSHQAGRERLTLVARAVIMYRGRMLLTRTIDRQRYFLPGGHVETGERVEDALRRELREELHVSITKLEFLGAYDNHFRSSSGERHHETGVVFRVWLNRYNVIAQEDHLIMSWIPVKQLSKATIVPKGLIRKIIETVSNRKPFWFVRVDR